LEKTFSHVNNLTKKQYSNIFNLLLECPELQDVNSLFKIDKELSSLAFFVKDLNNYINKKSEGHYLFVFKNDIQRRVRLVNKIMNLKKIN
jgi:hypothetical protein